MEQATIINVYIYIFICLFPVLVEGRKYSHDSVDMAGINVMLNTRDVSEYLKISPNGLEVRYWKYKKLNYVPKLFILNIVIFFHLCFVGSKWCIYIWKRSMHVSSRFWNLVLWNTCHNCGRDANWVGHKR